MNFFIKFFLLVSATMLLVAGENTPEVHYHHETCKCDCSYDEPYDKYQYPFGSKEFYEHYKFFNGRPHICLGKHFQPTTITDEKGGEVAFKYHPKDEKAFHKCTGIWCPRECCFDLEDLIRLRYEEEQKYFDISKPYRPYPVVPTPPPCSSEN